MSATTSGRWGRAPVAAASFAAARIRVRPSRGLVTGLGIAIAIAALFITTGSPIIAGDVTLRRALEELPSGQRSLTVAVSLDSSNHNQLPDYDARVRAGLHAPGLAAARAQVEYRALSTPSGVTFRFAGIDQLATAVALRDGRLPQQCDPKLCEVVIAGDTPTLDLPASLGLVIVGHVALTDSSLVTGQFRPNADEVVILGDGVVPVGEVKSLELIGRSVGWVAPIDPATIRVSEIDGVLGAAANTANTFHVSGVAIDLPRDALLGARARAATASNRVALAAAQGVVLLAAFALLAASGARRQHRNARQLLLQRGASRTTANVFTVFEAAWPVFVGLVIGVPLGLGATAVVADRSHLSAGDIVGTVLRDSAARVIVGALLLLVATSAIIGASPASPTGARQRRPWWRPMAIDGIGLGAVCVGVLAVRRGHATASTLVADGDPLLATLPLLAAVTMAWLAIRTVPLLVAAAARLLGRRAPLTRTALGEVRRRPIVPLATAGFLAAATTLGVFSLGYRATLATGAHDQAAFAVPYDFTLTTGPALVRPSALDPAAGWAAIAPGATSTPVLRRGVSVRNKQSTNDTVTLLGINPDTLPSMRGWRSDFGPTPTAIAALIKAAQPPAPFGTVIPIGTTSLALTGAGDLATTRVTAVLVHRDGTWHEIESKFSDKKPGELAVALDPGDAGGRFVGLRISQPERSEQLTQHGVGEGNTARAEYTSTITVSGVIARGAAAPTSLPIDLHSLSSQSAQLAESNGGLQISVALQGTSALVLPATGAQLTIMPAVVDPETAATAQNGIVAIDVAIGQRRQLRVAGVAARFPGAPSRFAVVDRALAQPSFDLLQAGYGTANEEWIAVDGRDVAALRTALGTAPFTKLSMADRAGLEQHLRTDPLAEFTLGLFAVAALIAAALAVAAVYLATMSDAADQAALHRALAAEGVAPRSLSRMVRTAAVAVALAAIALGTFGAALFLRLVTRVVAVTATSTVPVPPLVADASLTVMVFSVVGLLALCVVAASGAARAARRAAQGDLLREFG